MKLILMVFFTLLSACQLKPTKVVTQESVPQVKTPGAEILQQNPVLLDVRPAFEFNLAHATGAINVRWEDFSQQGANARGIPLADKMAMARRLALIGVDLKTPVVVLGKAHLGQAEEGRVAWTLQLLGVQKVYTLNANLVKDRSVVREAPAVQNKPYWSPVDKAADKMMISIVDFKSALLDTKTVILDVRRPEEVRMQSLVQSKKNLATFKSIEWKKFFNSQGSPSEDVLKELTDLGLTSDSQIIVISNHGVRSGAVTYALHFFGWKSVRNFAGGYEQYGYK